MSALTLSGRERARAAVVLGREAAALGVDRSLFRASPSGVRELPEPVAALVRQRAPNWACAIATAGCPAPLAAALVELFAQVRDEEEGQ
ncbi:MAG: hypothetical protein LC121_17775 [Anaerolineae bacterium]|nr:hypothetical protein [Anaerolineae bacterium]